MMSKEYIERAQLIAWLEEEKLEFEEEIDRGSDEDELYSEDAEIYDRGYLCALNEALSIAHEVPSVNLDDYRLEWISVDERLPESSGAYLIFTTIYFTPDHIDECDHYDGIEIAYYCNEFNCFQGNNVLYAKAWMPLPKPPCNVNGIKYLLSVDLAAVSPKEE